MLDSLKHLTLNRSFIFDGNREEFMDILRQTDNIAIEKTTKQEIKIAPTVSWGTLTFSGGASSYGINIRANLTEFGPNKLKVHLRTPIHPEHYLVIVTFIFFLVISGFSGGSKKSEWFYVLGIWIVCHLWFHFMYRLQENYILKKIVDKLGLKKV